MKMRTSKLLDHFVFGRRHQLRLLGNQLTDIGMVLVCDDIKLFAG
jgi:hypothetical protein